MRACEAGLEEVDGGDAVDDAVGAHFAGIVGEDGQASADAGLDEERLDFEVELAGAAQDRVERRDDGGDGDSGDLGGVDSAQGEELAVEDADLIDGGIAMRGDAPVGDEGRGGGIAGSGEAIEAENRVGVADIDG